jgi:cytoskeletal protein RodZ
MNKQQQSEQLINEQKQEIERIQQQATKLAEIGDRLQQKRLETSLTLEEMAVHTMIRVPMLQAIEEGKLEQLPESVYIQGLLLRYANALGFDGKAIAQEFPVNQKRFKLKNFWLNWPDYFPGCKLKPIHFYGVYLVAIVMGVQTLSQHLNSTVIQTATQEPEPNAAVLAATNQAGSANAAAANPQKSNSGAATATENNQRVRVGLTLQDASWVVIEADGKTEFEGMLPSGTERSWEASEKLKVLAGNAGGVLLAVNNGQAEQMGAPGEVIEREVLRSQPQN